MISTVIAKAVADRDDTDTALDLSQALQQIEHRFNARTLDLNGLADVVGFGEISCALRLQAHPDLVVKRLPVFGSADQAERYLACYRLYLAHLTSAGIDVARHSEWLVETPERVSLYIVQPAFAAESVAPRALHLADARQQRERLGAVLAAVEKLFRFNAEHPSVALSLDGQLSNWVFSEQRLIYIDTSTPLLRLDGQEQLDYEKLLTSTPALLRPIIRALFLQDVLDRYYDRRLVYVDLIANLYKENLAQLIPMALDLVAEYLSEPITEREVRRYYRQDKVIWQVFLAFRKIDRWLHTKLWRQTYQFMLPERVRR